MNLRKILATVLILVTVFVSAQPSFANQVESNNNRDATVINVTNLANPDPNTEVSEVLTFDELVKEISINEGISKKKAADQIKKNFNSSQKKSGNSLLASSSDSVTAESATYRSISAQFTVTSLYKPTLRFYTQTSEGGGYWGIVKILNVSMNRIYNDISKQFSGSVYTNLETPYRIFWIVEGDFYNNGTTTGGGSVNIGVGGTASVNFSVSYASNHYKAVYVEGRTVTQ